MKEKLYTIPLNEAVAANDECPFCFIERKLEQDTLDFVLGNGSSYMEADMRDLTDKAGFCREHFKKMYTYGNTLGNAWILKTHYMRILEGMKKNMEGYKPPKISFREKMKKNGESTNPIVNWISEKEDSCYFCNIFKDHYDRYMDTFFYLYEKDPEFADKIKNSKGFCLPHFKDMCLAADEKLNDKNKESFYEECVPLMMENMKRVFEDVSWMVEKFDYVNKDADWKNSRDAIQRGMQKLKGGYPADPVYKMNK